MDGVDDSRDLCQAVSVLTQPDVRLPHAHAVAQQADTGLQQLGVGLHGKSLRHRLKDDGMLRIVFGHLISYKKYWCMSAVLADHLGHLIAYAKDVQPAPFLL